MLKATIALLAALSILAVVGLASADGGGSPHLNNPPTFKDNGLTLTAAGQVYGLGNGGTVSLTATANATATCTNRGKSQPPGQNPASVTVSGGTVLDPNGTNGSRPFSVTTKAPASLIPSTSPDFSCANSNWTERITDLQFTSATLKATSQSSGGVFALASCTFSPATSDGDVPANTITC